MIALAIDREQLRSDLKVTAAYFALFVFIAAYLGGIIEVVGAVDFLPVIWDKAIAVFLLIFNVFVWKDEIQMIGAKFCRVPAQAYQRYTVEENAGGSGTEDSV